MMISCRCTGSWYRVGGDSLELMNVHQAALEGFGVGASAYERGRPGYPQDAVDWIVERLAIAAGSTVIDLGAGTGKFTRMLRDSGAAIYAVEPSAGMREQLKRLVPEATILDAAAEAIPLPAGTADAVTAAQSFHWFATDRVLAELQRVLRQGAGLALLWNRRDMNDPLQLRLEEVVAPYRGRTPAHENDRWKDAMRTTSRFEPIGQRDFTYEQALDRGGLVDRVLSISFMAALDRPAQQAVARQVESIAGVGTEIRLPYRTEVYLYRRVGA